MEPAAIAPAASCRAPAVSMYFEASGSVLSCCHNRLHPYGAVPSPVAEVWHGGARRALASWLAEGDLGHGCSACAFEIDNGNRAGSTAATFDGFEPGPWPKRMEFALSNRCNLACIMCSGEYSSRIRTERERLPPLPARYDDTFFEQLRPFLPHLEQARFFGGEPFLVAEYQRIWDLMVEVGATAECNVTTNGTVRTARVERVMEALPFSIGVSVDGATRDTVERIRVGADFDVVMANVSWFRDYCERRGTGFGLTYCLMVENWHELGAFLLMADDLGAGVAVNRVNQPTRHSLFHLGEPELRAVVATLDAEDERIRERLGANRRVWDAERAVLRNQLAERQHDPNEDAEAAALLAAVLTGAPFGREADVRRALDKVGLDDAASVMYTDGADRVVRTQGGAFLGIPEAQLVGRAAMDALAFLSGRFGTSVTVRADREAPGVVGRLIDFGDGLRTTTILALSVALSAEDGTAGRVLFATVFSTTPDGAGVRVELRPR